MPGGLLALLRTTAQLSYAAAIAPKPRAQDSLGRAANTTKACSCIRHKHSWTATTTVPWPRAWEAQACAATTDKACSCIRHSAATLQLALFHNWHCPMANCLGTGHACAATTTEACGTQLSRLATGADKGPSA